jgi:hypothetical protein
MPHVALVKHKGVHVEAHPTHAYNWAVGQLSICAYKATWLAAGGAGVVDWVSRIRDSSKVSFFVISMLWFSLLVIFDIIQS